MDTIRHDFNKLSLDKKTLLIEDIGTLLCSIEFYDHRVYLYGFNGLFVEAFQNIESKIIERITVASYGDLDKFLTRITLPMHKLNLYTPLL